GSQNVSHSGPQALRHEPVFRLTEGKATPNQLNAPVPDRLSRTCFQIIKNVIIDPGSRSMVMADDRDWPLGQTMLLAPGLKCFGCRRALDETCAQPLYQLADIRAFSHDLHPHLVVVELVASAIDCAPLCC